MSEILKLVSEAKEKVNNMFDNISILTNENSELFNSGPLFESINRLNLLYEDTNDKLTNPEFTLSTLGTTSSGKSTFVNGLLGIMLAPMDADELSAGTLKVTSNTNFIDKCNLKTGEDERKQISHESAYKYIHGIMTKYNKDKQEKDLAVPQISVETSFHISNNPELLGLDKNSKIQIIDLPGLRNISDSENLRVIQENVRTSFIIVLINYENLYNKEAVHKLYDELKVIKDSVGSTATMLFVINKVDRRNQTDKDIKDTISDCKTQIKEKLKLNQLPEIIAFNSYLFFNIQRAKFAYENNILLNVNQSNNTGFEVIRESIDIIFKDQANAISSIKSIDKMLIRELEDINEEGKIPDFELFTRFYNLCFQECGADVLFNSIINRTENSLRELILYPAMHKLIDETNNFFNLLENSVNMGKINSQEEIKDAKKKLESLSSALKQEIGNEKEKFKNRIQLAVDNILDSDKTGKKLKEGIKLLNIGQVEDLIKNVKEKVEKDTIAPVTEAFKNQYQFYDLSLDLIDNYKWKVENVNILKNPFHKIQLELFSNKEFINKGKKFEVLKSSNSDNLTIDKIIEDLDLLNESIKSSMNEHLKLEMQKKVNEFTNRINESLNSDKTKISNKLEKILKEISIDIKLPDINSENLSEIKYKTDFSDKIISEGLRDEKISIKQIQSGYRTIQESYNTTETYNDVEISYERVWYKLWIGKSKVETNVERQRNVTKYRPLEVPNYENKEIREISFYNVEDMGYSWVDSLDDLETDLWLDIGDYLVEILGMSLSSYEKSILKIMEQIELILDKRDQEIKSQKESKILFWNKLDILNKECFEQYKDLKSIISTKKDN